MEITHISFLMRLIVVQQDMRAPQEDNMLFFFFFWSLGALGREIAQLPVRMLIIAAGWGWQTRRAEAASQKPHSCWRLCAQTRLMFHEDALRVSVNAPNWRDQSFFSANNAEICCKMTPGIISPEVLTCAAMSISLFTFSFFPSLVLRKSRRHPASERSRP